MFYELYKSKFILKKVDYRISLLKFVTFFKIKFDFLNLLDLENKMENKGWKTTRVKTLWKTKDGKQNGKQQSLPFYIRSS